MSKTRNISDLSKKKSETLSLGDKKPVWFIREKMLRFYDSMISDWEFYCKEHKIEPIEEVVDEIKKLRYLIETEKNITSKMVDFKLILGYKPVLDDLAIKWLDDYLYF